MNKNEKYTHLLDEQIRKSKPAAVNQPTTYQQKAYIRVDSHVTDLSQDIGRRIEYSKHKGIQQKSCESLIIDSIKEHGRLTRKDIDELLWHVLSDQLSDSQKKSKIGNILRKMKGKVFNETNGPHSYYYLK